MTATSIGWFEIGRISWPDIVALHRHWEKWPPTHVSLAAMIRAYGKSSQTDNDLQLEDAMFAGSGPAIPFDSLPPMVKAFLQETNKNPNGGINGNR